MEHGKNKILVADDDKEIRDILSMLLTQEGYEVVLARDGRGGFGESGGNH